MHIYYNNLICTICNNSKSFTLIYKNINDGRGSELINIYKCSNCKQVFLGNYDLFYNEELYNYYDDYISYNMVDIFNPLTQLSYSKVIKLLKSKSEKLDSILDVGCGMGEFVYSALKSGINATGIEFSESAVKIAKKYNLPVSKVDFNSASLSNMRFDAITFFEVFEHLNKPYDFLTRASSLLNPNGLIYLTTPNFNSLDRYIYKDKWTAIHREHINYFTTKSIKKLLKMDKRLNIVYFETRNASLKIFFKNNIKSLDVDLNSREIINNSVILKIIKFILNKILNVLGIGSTMIIILKKIE